LHLLGLARALMAPAQRVAVQLPAPGECIDKSVLVVKMPTILESAASGAGQLQRLVGPTAVGALVLCSIRTRYTADTELCNNATPYRRAKTTTYSGSLVIGPQHAGIIMQQSRR